MVRYDSILKAIEKEIVKCSVTLKSIREQISPLVKRISDSQEEYDILMEEIPRFYRDNYNKDTEEMIMKYKNGETFHASGDESSVRLSSEDSDRTFDLRESGIYPLLSIHNHPSGINFLSIGDVGSQAIKKEKYTIVVSKKGIAINKLDKWGEDNSLKRHGQAVKSYWGLERQTKEKIKNHPRMKNLEEDTKNKLSKAKTHDERMSIQADSHKAVDNLVGSYIQQHVGESRDILNDQFKKNNVPMKIETIDIKKKYEQ